MISQLVDDVRLLRQGATPAQVREVHRLLRQARYADGTSTLTGRRLQHVDGASFVSAWRAIHLDRVYDLPPGVATPRIIDGGANVGLATLRWLQRHPGARITAFEADPRVCATLRSNLDGQDGVEVVEAALWDADGTTSFVIEGGDAGHVGAGGTTVDTARLGPWLVEPVDLLKLDVEGAELAVLRDARDGLPNVARVFVEYHRRVDEPSRLHELLALLADEGFRTYPLTEFCSPRPMLERAVHAGMDVRVNVVAIREDHLPASG